MNVSGGGTATDTNTSTDTHTLTDANSCTNSDTIVADIQICGGVDDIIDMFGILIYPNPNTGLFTIEKPSGLNKVVNV